ncbi:NAD(P)/FAD-dependent oxidoreductase [Paraburkholderia mimosarum]|uniref:NAD(P)/FAD-dependent oxidoreductase n=1 Tax=Paraburkholderia mimosarum TaxID=312026 RepID=UPI0039C3E290
MNYDCVLGAGIVGISAALNLQARGRYVCVVDRELPAAGASIGNAGLIERSSVIPYAFPRQPGRLLRYALNREPDVRYAPNAIPGIARWLINYWKQSGAERLQHAAAAMLPLIERCVAEHDELIDRSGIGAIVSNRGWMEIFRDLKLFCAAREEAESLARYKLSYDVLHQREILDFEPGLNETVIGGIRWNDPKSVRDPGAMLAAYTSLFQREGGTLAKGDAQTLRRDGAMWLVESYAANVRAENVVIALGADSDLLCNALGYRVPLAAKRGCHLHFHPVDHGMPKLPICDSTGGYVLAPMAAGIRLTTGIEFARRNAPPNPIQIRRAERLARSVFRLGRQVERAPWMGRRPCLPDMRPIIGPAPNHRGVWFDFGHAHHGLTLGPVSGRLLAEQMTGAKPFTDPAPFSITRFI